MSNSEILDLSDSGPDSREWKEFEKHIQELIACHLQEWLPGFIREAYPNDTGAEPPPDKVLQENAALIRKGLERYRTEPPDSNIRKYIDFLLRVHGKSKIASLDSQYKNRHNALVLEYSLTRAFWNWHR